LLATYLHGAPLPILVLVDQLLDEVRGEGDEKGLQDSHEKLAILQIKNSVAKGLLNGSCTVKTYVESTFLQEGSLINSGSMYINKEPHCP
jgi:hypothetical protein